MAGDYLSDVEFPFIEDYEAYLATIQKAQKIILDKKVEVIVPGHGTTTNNRSEIQKRIDASLLYLNNLSSGNVDESELQKLYPFYKGLKEMHELNKKYSTKIATGFKR